MNLLDRTIGWFAPHTAVKRMGARMAIQLMGRSYEGAKGGRRTDGWVTTGASANTEIATALARTRDRARDLVRNNPFATAAVSVIETNAVGTGIIAKANTGAAGLDKQIDDVWAEWIQECDADGQNDFYGLQALIARAIVESGECFVRYRNRPSSAGMLVPLQLQVLESDYLDQSKNAPNGPNLIVQGIEFSPIGERVAYWMFTQHPGDTFTAVLRRGFMSVRVPASEILHLYRIDRPGQVRGITWFAPVILRARAADEFDDAELMRKKIAACLAGIVTQEAGEDGPTIGPVTTDSAPGQKGKNQRVESFSPGMIAYLKPGEQMTFNNPQDSGNYEAFSRTQLRAIATGVGVTYEDMTGDLSNVNYSSYRAGHLRHHRMVIKFRRGVLISRLCQPVRQRFIDTAFIAGAIARQDYRAKYTGVQLQSIDPGKDVAADLKAIRGGLMTLPDAVAQRGHDFDEQITAIAASNKKLDDLDITLDSDPRRVTQTGLAVQPTQTGDSDNA